MEFTTNPSAGADTAARPDRDPLSQGWDDYYRVDDLDAAWGDAPPPFLVTAVAPYLRDGIAAADFGSGDGRNALLLAWRSVRLTLVDIAPAGLRRAEARFRARGLMPAPRFVQGSLEDLPLGPDQFDLAFCIDALPQVRRADLALAEMARVLKPGAILVVNFYTPDDDTYGEGEAIGVRCYRYKGTLFNYYDEADVVPLLNGRFDVVSHTRARWQDPPHVPFRPYPHTHDSLVYVLRAR